VERFACVAALDVVEQLHLVSSPSLGVETLARAEIVPTRGVVAAGLPRMHDLDQARAASTVAQKVDQRPLRRFDQTDGHLDAPPKEFRDGVTEHRRLGDGRRARSTPELDGPLRIELVAHVGDETRRVDRGERRREFADRPLGRAQFSPDQGVKAAVPEP